LKGKTIIALRGRRVEDGRRHQPQMMARARCSGGEVGMGSVMGVGVGMGTVGITRVFLPVP